MQTNLDIFSNPKLLAKMTQQDSEVLTYEQMIERFKQLQRPVKARPQTPCPF